VPSFTITGNRLMLLRKTHEIWLIRKSIKSLLVDQGMLMHNCISGFVLLLNTAQHKFVSSQLHESTYANWISKVQQWNISLCVCSVYSRTCKKSWQFS